MPCAVSGSRLDLELGIDLACFRPTEVDDLPGELARRPGPSAGGR
jgi:hypothetical protein